jgi:Cft2 family RNA processing exonuclease
MRGERNDTAILREGAVDVSRPGQKTVGGIEIPHAARGADLMLLESTYAGSGRRAPREVEVAQLVRDVITVTSAGGRVLIPAFALGRAQEVAAVLAEHLPDVDVLVDGMARDVTAVYESHTGPDGGPLRIFGSRVRRVPTGGTHAAIASLRTGVVIATSGMLTAGPAVSWARALLPDPAAGLMIVGYQDEESPRRAVAGAGRGRGRTVRATDADRWSRGRRRRGRARGPLRPRRARLGGRSGRVPDHATAS